MALAMVVSNIIFQEKIRFFGYLLIVIFFRMKWIVIFWFPFVTGYLMALLNPF